jgi:hypothetical protein
VKGGALVYVENNRVLCAQQIPEQDPLGSTATTGKSDRVQRAGEEIGLATRAEGDLSVNA